MHILVILFEPISWALGGGGDPAILDTTDHPDMAVSSAPVQGQACSPCREQSLGCWHH